MRILGLSRAAAAVDAIVERFDAAEPPTSRSSSSRWGTSGHHTRRAPWWLGMRAYRWRFDIAPHSSRRWRTPMCVNSFGEPAARRSRLVRSIPATPAFAQELRGACRNHRPCPSRGSCPRARAGVDGCGGRTTKLGRDDAEMAGVAATTTFPNHVSIQRAPSSTSS